MQVIASAMKDTGKGIIQMVLDAPHRSWEEEIEHLISITQSSVPATFTLGTSNRGPRVWDAAIARVSAANATGSNISPQLLPRPVGLLMGHELSTNPFCVCPTYVEMQSLSLEDKLARLHDPAIRAALIAEDPDEGNAFAASARNWDWMFPLGDPPNYEPSADESVGARARAAGVSPAEYAYDYLLEQDGRAILYNALGNFHEGKLDAVYELLNHPDVVVGLGDGGAHYGAICDASYTTFMLTYWMRDREGPRLTMPNVVRMLSARTAEVVGLLDRGRIAPGYKADVNVIDLEGLRLHTPHVRHDLPGGGRRLDQQATGYIATICSGRVIRRFDEATAERPGSVVRGAQVARVLEDMASA